MAAVTIVAATTIIVIAIAFAGITATRTGTASGAGGKSSSAGLPLSLGNRCGAVGTAALFFCAFRLRMLAGRPRPYLAAGLK